jgi:hypothetical protein
MNAFVKGVVSSSNKTRTENGMASLKSSLNANVDLFFAIGASRGKDLTTAFDRAYAEDPDMAIRCLLWARDARGGAGERDMFRNLMQHLENTGRQHLVERILPLVPELGRWDDLLVFKTEAVKNKAMSLIGQALFEQNQLAAKWMPRKGKIAQELRTFFGLTPKQYRKGLVALSNTVEQRMCAKQWDSIEFGKLPSLASARYQKAFLRNAAEKYALYKNALVKGEAKINASVAYPYDVTRSLNYGDATVADAQWKALPNYLSKDAKLLPMIDVSSSMGVKVGDNPNLTCMEVAIGLGLYVATKQEGPFAGMYLTFHDHPTLEVLKKGNLKTQYNQVKSSAWGGSTNFEGAYMRILQVAVQNNVKPEDMPDYMIVFSDMQFNSAQGYYGLAGRNDTAFTAAKKAFANAGYKLPKIIFWNLAARAGQTPVTYDQDGTALVSGFSPSLMTSILSAKTVTPEGIMRETLMKPRYNLPA